MRQQRRSDALALHTLRLHTFAVGLSDARFAGGAGTPAAASATAGGRLLLVREGSMGGARGGRGAAAPTAATPGAAGGGIGLDLRGLALGDQRAGVDEKPALGDGGALLASDGGVISVGGGDPIFHAASGTQEPARLARVGGERTWSGKARESDPGEGRAGIVAMCGPHAWIWRRDAFYVIDLREW